MTESAPSTLSVPRYGGPADLHLTNDIFTGPTLHLSFANQTHTETDKLNIQKPTHTARQLNNQVHMKTNEECTAEAFGSTLLNDSISMCLIALGDICHHLGLVQPSEVICEGLRFRLLLQRGLQQFISIYICLICCHLASESKETEANKHNKPS